MSVNIKGSRHNLKSQFILFNVVNAKGTVIVDIERHLHFVRFFTVIKCITGCLWIDKELHRRFRDKADMALQRLVRSSSKSFAEGGVGNIMCQGSRGETVNGQGTVGIDRPGGSESIACVRIVSRILGWINHLADVMAADIAKTDGTVNLRKGVVGI